METKTVLKFLASFAAFVFDVVTDILLVFVHHDRVWNTFLNPPADQTTEQRTLSYFRVAGYFCLVFAAVYGIVIFFRAVVQRKGLGQRKDYLALAMILGFFEAALEIGGLSLLIAGGWKLNPYVFLSLVGTVVLYLFTLIAEYDVVKRMSSNGPWTTLATGGSPLLMIGLFAVSRFYPTVPVYGAVALVGLGVAMPALYALLTSWERLVAGHFSGMLAIEGE